MRFSFPQFARFSRLRRVLLWGGGIVLVVVGLAVTSRLDLTYILGSVAATPVVAPACEYEPATIEQVVECATEMARSGEQSAAAVRNEVPVCTTLTPPVCRACHDGEKLLASVSLPPDAVLAGIDLDAGTLNMLLPGEGYALLHDGAEIAQYRVGEGSRLTMTQQGEDMALTTYACDAPEQVADKIVIRKKAPELSCRSAFDMLAELSVPQGFRVEGGILHAPPGHAFFMATTRGNMGTKLAFKTGKLKSITVTPRESSEAEYDVRLVDCAGKQHAFYTQPLKASAPTMQAALLCMAAEDAFKKAGTPAACREAVRASQNAKCSAALDVTRCESIGIGYE